jgi:hypothetical protein
MAKLDAKASELLAELNVIDLLIAEAAVAVVAAAAGWEAAAAAASYDPAASAGSRLQGLQGRRRLWWSRCGGSGSVPRVPRVRGGRVGGE